MKQVIVYGSKYGSTKAYAQKLSELTNTECYSYKDRVSLKGYDRIVYMGSLFGGQVRGLKKTARRIPKASQVILVTVGILDITNKDNFEYVKKTSLKQMPANMVNSTVVHCLMGKSDYSALKWADKMIMNIVHKGMSQKPVNERSVNESKFIDNFKTVADMMDFNSLNSIISDMKR